MTPLLFEILLRFRMFPIAIISDIEKAFLQILQISLVWKPLRRQPHNDSISIHTRSIWSYKFTFFAEWNLGKHAIKYENIDPEFVERVLKSFFVDDFTGGEFTVESAIEFYKKLKLRYLEGNFNGMTWTIYLVLISQK